jgi:hypothetical protein
MPLLILSNTDILYRLFHICVQRLEVWFTVQQILVFGSIRLIVFYIRFYLILVPSIIIFRLPEFS